MLLKSLASRCVNPLHVSLLAFSVMASTSFADASFLAVDSTPYDRQMTRVQPILAVTDIEATDDISVVVVNQWMSKVRQIPYRYSKQWQTPDEVTRMKTADCKGKAVVLYEMMRRMGATDVRLVIGKHRAGDWFTHAWLEWDTEHGSYLLDPTFFRHAVTAELQRRNTYIPLYAYDGEFRYRAQSPIAPAEIPLRAVASGKRSWAMPMQPCPTQVFAGLN